MTHTDRVRAASIVLSASLLLPLGAPALGASVRGGIALPPAPYGPMARALQPPPDCSKPLHTGPAVPDAFVDRAIAHEVRGQDRAVVRDILLALPPQRRNADVVYYDGNRLYSNHPSILPAIEIWRPVLGSATLYSNAQGEISVFPDDGLPSPDVGTKFSPPPPSDGGARVRYSNTTKGYAVGCSLIDTTATQAGIATNSGDTPYAYLGGYAGVVPPHNYTASADSGLQFQPNHPAGADATPYLKEAPGVIVLCNPKKSATCDFAFQQVFRVEFNVLATPSSKLIVDNDTIGYPLKGGAQYEIDISELAAPAWNLAGQATVIKRATTIGQRVPGCGTTMQQCRVNGSFFKNVRWYGSYIGNNVNPHSRVPWMPFEGTGYECVPDDSRVQVNYVSAAEETDSISLTTPTKLPCTN